MIPEVISNVTPKNPRSPSSKLSNNGGELGEGCEKFGKNYCGLGNLCGGNGGGGG